MRSEWMDEEESEVLQSVDNPEPIENYDDR